MIFDAALNTFFGFTFSKKKGVPLAKDLSTIAKGAGFYLFGFIISKALALFYRVMVFRLLGPEAFGVFSAGVAFEGLALVFAGLGLYQGIMHYVSVYDSRGEEAKVRGSILFSLKAQLLASLIVGLAIFLLADFIAIKLYNTPSLATVLKVLAFAPPFAVLASSLAMTALAFKKIEYKILTRNIIEIVAKIAFTGALLFLGLGLFGVTLGLLLSYGVASLALLYFVQKKVFPLFGKGLESVENGKEMFSYSWPLLAVGFFEILMTSIDTLMLGSPFFVSISGMYQAGIYNVAYPVAHLLIFAPTAFGSLFLPIVTRQFAQRNLKDMSQTYKTVTRWTFAVIFPMLLFTIAFSKEILWTFFGKEAAAGTGALIILSIATFVVAFVGQVRPILQSIKKTKLIFFNSIVSAVANIILNAWLIPLFAIQGAAIIGAALATLLTYVIWNALALAEVHSFTKIHPYEKAYLQPTAAALAAITGFFFLKQALPEIGPMPFHLNFAVLSALGISFLAFYGLLFLAFKGLQKEDILVLKAFEAKTGTKLGFAKQFIKRFI
jgi:O-antigen/teichoic acid export membrane protein